MDNKAEAAALKAEKPVANDALNLVAVSDKGASALNVNAGKTELTTITGPGKALPAVDLFDSKSNPAEQNKEAVSKSDKPNYDGTSNWAALENYTLASGKVDPKAGDLKEQNKESVNKNDQPKYEGTTNWAALENYTLATGKNETKEHSAPDAHPEHKGHTQSQDHNANSVNKGEKPKYKGTSTWAPLEGYSPTDKP